MPEETAILILEQRLEEPLRDRFHPWKTPLLVGCQAGAQQPAVRCKQDRAKRIIKKLARQSQPEKHGKDEQNSAQEQEGPFALAKENAHRVISTHFPVLLAWKDRSYMDSTDIPGW
jgi:hypothetical protein